MDEILIGFLDVHGKIPVSEADYKDSSILSRSAQEQEPGWDQKPWV